MNQSGKLGYRSSLFRVLAMGLTAVLLVACGGDSGSDTTPTPTAESAAPTIPPIASPSATIEMTDLTVVTPESTPVEISETAQVTVATPATGPETTATTSATPHTDTAATAEPDEPDASPDRTPTGKEWTQSVGDGTGGSGAPGEQEPGDEIVDATPVATPVVATLTVDGCDVPDVPNFTGEVTEFVLTSDVNFRTGPGVGCDLVFDLPLGEGQVVTVSGGPVIQAEDDTEWVQIEIDDQTGWVSSEFLEPVEP